MDPVIPVVNAESTPAIVAPPAEPVITPDDMAKYRQERRESFKGASKPQARSVEDKTAATSNEDGGEADTETETPSGEKPAASPKPAAASEAAQSQERTKKRSDAAQRIQELLEENRQLRLKTEPRTDGKQDSSPAASAAKPEPAKLRPEPKLDDKNEQGQPKYATWDDWFADTRKWDREAARMEATQASEQSRKDAEVETQKRSHADKWMTQIDEARKEFKDFDQVALTREIGEKIPPGSVIEAYILRRNDGAKMLYHLGQHPEKIAEVLKMDPFDQSEALIAISRGFAGNGSAKPGDKPEPPAKKISQAPAPPVVVGGSAGPVPDEVEQSVKDEDMAAYRHARRSRVLASVK